MKIKERERSNLYHYSKKILRFIYRGISNRKTKIVFLVIIMTAFFLTGSLFGLIITGFFGTFDEPSQRALNIMHSMGITELRALKTRIEWLMSENIKIPFNYLRGQFSNPEKIYIDIAFQDYQKLEYKRQQALEKGVLISSGVDYVPAKIRYKDKQINVDLRLKGDWLDHIKGNKWSFRIRVKGNETLFGIKTFSIQKPSSRLYLNSLVYYRAMGKEDILAPRTDFIEVFINGERKGIYNFEEHFEKRLIEYNNRRSGVIIKFSEDLMWDETAHIKDFFPNRIDLYSYQGNRTLDWFYSSNIEPFNAKILEDPVLSIEFEKAKNLLESFRKGSLKTSEVFDTGKLAKYFAVNTIVGSAHPSEWNNIRFYYNPITSLLEPIAYDGGISPEIFEVIEYYLPNCLITNENDCSQKQASWLDLIFRDQIFFEKYMQELEQISQESYLDDLFLELDEEIKKDISILHKDYPFYHFSKEIIYGNPNKIKNRLNPVKSLNAYLQKSLPSENKIVLSIGNIDFFPLKIVNLVYNDSIIFELNQRDKIIQPRASIESVEYQKYEFDVPANFLQKEDFALNLKINYKIFGTENTKSQEVLPWAYVKETFLEEDFIRNESNLTSFAFLKIDEKTKSIIIQKGNWALDKSLIIPPGFSVFFEAGTVINLMNRATILSYSDLQFYGTKAEPIKIISSDGTGQGLTVLNANKISNLKYVIFNNLKNPSKEGWELTGAVTFYESPAILNNVIFNNIKAEDSLNIIRTKFEIKNSNFKNCFSDCFDGDFVNGSIESSLFSNSGNDGIDFSGSFVNIIDTNILNAGDKAISVGEKSNVIIENIEINNSELNKTYICIASKDKSDIFIKNAKISDCEYGFAVYQKKSEFGSASIKGTDINISDVDNNYIVESDSNLLIDDKIILGSKQKVYEMLYGVK